MLLSLLFSHQVSATVECNGLKYSPLGCFTDEYPFSVEGYRNARMPWSISRVDPWMKLTNALYTELSVDWQRPEASRFLADRPVVVMTHGWNSAWNSGSWLNAAQSAYQQYGAVNFVGLDWSGGANTIDYPRAAANCLIAGRAIGYMFHKLRRAGFQGDLHCGGHSLGAHVCSYAAKYARDEFGIVLNRVTGLDPAGPLFEMTEPPVRIDKSDADFVDIIHTNGGLDNGFLGMNRAVGHADFYPNGGRQQPGCGVNFSCSHSAAYLFYIDSIKNNGCSFLPCDSDNYSDGNCNYCPGSSVTDCNVMGQDAYKPRNDTTYYGNTKSADSPYC